MKKFCLLGVCLAVGIAASAQANLVKDVEHALKESNPNYEAIAKQIQPALTDPATMNLAQPWYLAGKANFGLYDQLYLQEQLGNPLDANGKKTAGKAMIDGYGCYFTAIPLDQQPDEKGKVKPKYTKEMIKGLKGNYAQLKNAGVFLFEAQDFKGAYDAWEIYVNLPQNPILGKDTFDGDPDTIVGNMMYYQLLAALSCDMNAEALAKVAQIEKTGYQNIDVYVYGIEAARRLDDSVAMMQLAHKGYELYGTQNIQFIGQMINERLQKEDYAGCEDLCQQAIASTDDQAIKGQLYDILGIVYEQQNKPEAAIDCFNKAIELDPEQGKNYYDKARMIYNQGVALDEQIENATERDAQVKPRLLEAAELFEKAYGLDEENLTQIPNILYRLYYRLGQGYEDKANYWKDI